MRRLQKSTRKNDTQKAVYRYENVGAKIQIKLVPSTAL
jgi:hypothetical protein